MSAQLPGPGRPPAHHSYAPESPLIPLLLIVVSSYLLGCIVASYYLGRYAPATARGQKSRNAHMRMSAITFLLDAAKGALAVWMASELVLRPWAGAVAFTCVIAGHVFPMQLGFRGGKGVAPGLGGLAVFTPLVAILVLAIGSIIAIITRGATKEGLWLAGVVAVALTPPIMAFLGHTQQTVAGVAAGCTLILLAHHPIFERIRPPQGAVKPAD